MAIVGLVVGLLAFHGTARAQLAEPGPSGVVMGHLHLATKDMEASRRFWAALTVAPAETRDWYARTFGATSDVLPTAAPPQIYIAQLPGLSMYFANLSPTVLGQLRTSSGPLVATPVALAVRTAGTTCAAPSAVAATQASGRFAFRPVREFHWFVFVMAHRHFEWDVCVKLDGQWIPAKSYREYTLVDFGPVWADVIRCEVDSPSGAGPQFQCQEAREWDLSEDEFVSWPAQAKSS